MWGFHTVFISIKHQPNLFLQVAFQSNNICILLLFGPVYGLLLQTTSVFTSVFSHAITVQPWFDLKQRDPAYWAEALWGRIQFNFSWAKDQLITEAAAPCFSILPMLPSCPYVWHIRWHDEPWKCAKVMQQKGAVPPWVIKYETFG